MNGTKAKLRAAFRGLDADSAVLIVASAIVAMADPFVPDIPLAS
jgi:hypothetical protein